MNLKLLRDVVAVAGNEFRQFRRNRTAILISLVILPVFFTFTLGAGSGSATSRFSPTSDIPIAFIDNDLSTASGRLLEALRSSGDFNNLILGYTQEHAISVLGTGKIYAALVVPPGFQDGLTTNQTGTIVLYADDGEPGVADQVSATLQNDVHAFNPNVDVQTVTGAFQQVEVIQKGALFSSFNVGFVIVLGIVQIFATFYEIAGGMSRERDDGTLARLLVTPTGIGAIMLGKTLFDLVLASVRTIAVLGLAVFLYGARPNTDLGTLLAVSLIVALVTIGFGFVISALRVGQRAVVILEFFLVLFLFAFSGLIIDKELLRGISRQIANVLPWAYGFDLLRRTVLLGLPLTSLANDLQFIIVSTTAFFAISYAIFALSRERIAF